MNKIRSVLIIDDDRDDFDIISEAFAAVDPGIQLEFVERKSGIDCEFDKFDMVFLDINMPHFDGFAWLADIRERCRNRIPVIMYTNSAYPAHIQRAYKSGANLYLSKPDGFKSLVAALKKVITMDWSNPALVKESFFHNGVYEKLEY